MGPSVPGSSPRRWIPMVKPSPPRSLRRRRLRLAGPAECPATPTCRARRTRGHKDPQVPGTPETAGPVEHIQVALAVEAGRFHSGCVPVGLLIAPEVIHPAYRGFTAVGRVPGEQRGGYWPDYDHDSIIMIVVWTGLAGVAAIGLALARNLHPLAGYRLRQARSCCPPSPMRSTIRTTTRRPSRGWWLSPSTPRRLTRSGGMPTCGPPSPQPPTTGSFGGSRGRTRR